MYSELNPSNLQEATSWMESQSLIAQAKRREVGLTGNYNKTQQAIDEGYVSQNTIGGRLGQTIQETQMDIVQERGVLEDDTQEFLQETQPQPNTYGAPEQVPFEEPVQSQTIDSQIGRLNQSLQIPDAQPIEQTIETPVVEEPLPVEEQVSEQPSGQRYSPGLGRMVDYDQQAKQIATAKEYGEDLTHSWKTNNVVTTQGDLFDSDFDYQRNGDHFNQVTPKDEQFQLTAPLSEATNFRAAKTVQTGNYREYFKPGDTVITLGEKTSDFWTGDKARTNDAKKSLGIAAAAGALSVGGLASGFGSGSLTDATAGKPGQGFFPPASLAGAGLMTLAELPTMNYPLYEGNKIKVKPGIDPISGKSYRVGDRTTLPNGKQAYWAGKQYGWQQWSSYQSLFEKGNLR